MNKLFVNDMVLIKDDEKQPRLQWKKGVIEELIVGRDEKIRGAVIRTMSRDGTKILIKRDIKRLIPFELPKEINDNFGKRESVLNADLVRKVI